MDCVFCEGIEDHQVLIETENYKVVFDIDPIQIGHLLIISKAHYETLLEINEELLIELLAIQKQMIALLEKEFHVDGVSIIQNNGEIMDKGTHFHVHVVPRYHDDHFWANQQVVDKPLSIDELVKELKHLTRGN
ncbi:HIT family protein [Solibacillus sp. MA9]|uniref:HIT family protein n=1 Tax=Solibacillus palustris TaxID=2908203 RepID=A0ABS9UC31_9BACL|nr:HIT family protein [Solibacillus sp. MA9]MCH7321901.1 HIT family protein [Solibacillus sp. MA9]